MALTDSAVLADEPIDGKYVNTEDVSSKALSAGT